MLTFVRNSPEIPHMREKNSGSWSGQLFLQFRDLENLSRPSTLELYLAALTEKVKVKPKGPPLLERRCNRCEVAFRTRSKFTRTCRSCRRSMDYQHGEADYSIAI